MLEPHERVRSEAHTYEILEFVGQGGQAYGYRSSCPELASDHVFLKQYHEPPFIPIEDPSRAVLKLQRGLLERIKSNTFVQRAHEFFEYEGAYYQSGSWQEGVSLRAVIDRGYDGYPRRDRKLHAVTLCYAIKTLHEESRVAHLDLSPNNVRIVQGEDGRQHVHLTDFDNSTFDGCAPVVVAGTPGYIAPEKIDPAGAGLEGHIGYPSDVFSLGCLLYEVLFSIPPWSGETEASDPNLLIAEKGRAYHPSQFSAYFDRDEQTQAMANLLWSSLAPRPADRPTAGQIHTAMLRLDIDDDEDFPAFAEALRPFPAKPTAPGPGVESDVDPISVSAPPTSLRLRCGEFELLLDDSTIVGREQLRGLPDYATVSSRHARFFRQDGVGWFVMHVGSTNPTYVDGSPVGRLARARLESGSVVRLGRVEFEVVEG